MWRQYSNHNNKKCKRHTHKKNSIENLFRRPKAKIFYEEEKKNYQPNTWFVYRIKVHNEMMMTTTTTTTTTTTKTVQWQLYNNNHNKSCNSSSNNTSSKYTQLQFIHVLSKYVHTLAHTFYNCLRFQAMHIYSVHTEVHSVHFFQLLSFT